MKIVLATPLYPPDIAEPAPYVKELAKRLSPIHQVTVVAYGRLPEQVPGVRIVAVDKRRALPMRLWAFYRALAREARAADLVIAENGPSVELPALFIRGPLVLHLGDRGALGRNRLLTAAARWRASKVVEEMPAERPEILPFVPKPEQAFAAYERSWSEYMQKLEALFSHVG